MTNLDIPLHGCPFNVNVYDVDADSGKVSWLPGKNAELTNVLVSRDDYLKEEVEDAIWLEVMKK